MCAPLDEAGSPSSGAIDTAPPDRPGRGKVFWAEARSVAPVLLGLSALGVAFRLLDLFGKNPEYFIAGRIGSVGIVVFAVASVVVAPVGLTLMVGLGAAIGPTLGLWMRRLAVWVLGFAVALVVLRSVDVESTVIVGALGLVAASAIVVGIEQLAGLALLAQYLAWANVAFLGLFLVASPTAELVWNGSADTAEALELAGDPPPTVVVVLDELPLTALVDADGEINESRFPGFAELARRSTWFRNATAVAVNTEIAVPSLFTGNITAADDLPTLSEHPDNLFSLLGPLYEEADSYELVSDMCPPSVCPLRQDRRSFSTIVKDIGIVYGHLTLPSSFRQELPPIDNQWGDFGGSGNRITAESPLGRYDALAVDEKSPAGQAAILANMIGRIRPGPNLYVGHIALPHFPWELTPFGYANTADFSHHSADPGTPRQEFLVNQNFQRLVLQTGAADGLITTLITRLDELGIWDEALVVVASDHGISMLPPDTGRFFGPTPETVDEITRVPLFIKHPAQAEGERRDENARTIDILPSILDLVGVEHDVETDGHSLYDDSAFPTVNELVPFSDDGVTAVPTDVAPLLELARRHADAFTADDWLGLFGVGPYGDYVGRPVEELTVAGTRGAVKINELTDFETLDLGAGVPQVITGTIAIEPDATPPELLVVLNGTVAGIAGGYGWDGPESRVWSAALGDWFVDGENELRVLWPLGDHRSGEFAEVPVRAS